MAEKKYWKGLEELDATPEFEELAQKEFPEELPVEMFGNQNESNSASRRDFLKMLGFSVTAAAIAGCEMPVNRVAPYIFKPENVTPGIATWYASTFMDGGDYCSILVKTREGRPIKVEGNTASMITKGGTSARVQASVLSLYDTARLQGPMVKNDKGNFGKAEWAEVDAEIVSALSGKENASVAVLTSTIISPSTRKVLAGFAEKYPNTKVYTYDAVSASGALDANEEVFGVRALPKYHFNKAKTIVGFDCDFLGTWVSPTEFTKAYVKTRKVSKEHPEMSRHYQFESRLSLTGSNADYRVPLKPSEVYVSLLNLYDAVTGSNLSGGKKVNDEAKAARVVDAAQWLKKHRGESLVVSGSNNKSVQLLVNAINLALDNYGKTLDMSTPSMLRQGSDKDLMQFVENAGNAEVVMVYGCNPVYDTPVGAKVKEILNKVNCSISFAGSMDETAKECHYICPDSHYLESWNDAEPVKGCYSLSQPAIRNLFDTRQMQDSLLTWSGSATNYYDFLVNNWLQGPLSGEANGIKAFNKALQTGLYQPTPMGETSEATTAVAANEIDTASAASMILPDASALAKGLELCLFEKVAIGDGRYANNPWLHEMPDPISKVTWDNYISLSPAYAEENGLRHGDIVSVKAGDVSAEFPVVIQPGQANGSASIALGYGRSEIGKAGKDVGVNAYPFLRMKDGAVEYETGGVALESTGKNIQLAQTQTHYNLNDGLGKRSIVKETTLNEYKKNPLAGNTDRADKLGHLDTFYPDFQAGKNGFDWGMSIDLNSCVGCGACTVACISENNVPVVGREEVIRAHEMHWIRIDRYYAGNDPENPEVVFQPMMCQHCENAPCENVCPVGATNHSSEGYNQMAYNRCIGTRYCANNCPYKVRRFNWFDYGGNDTFGTMNDPEAVVEMGMMEDLTRMVLNPDVTVRSRGVIEKCSFCVQRIQEGKLSAKKESRKLRDGEIRTACQSACPADAIVFGNMFDENTEVYKLNHSERAYGIIEEMHWLPSVLYLTKVRNKDKSDHVHEQGEGLDEIMDLYNYQ